MLRRSRFLTCVLALALLGHVLGCAWDCAAAHGDSDKVCEHGAPAHEDHEPNHGAECVGHPPGSPDRDCEHCRAHDHHEWSSDVRMADVTAPPPVSSPLAWTSSNSTTPRRSLISATPSASGPPRTSVLLI